MEFSDVLVQVLILYIIMIIGAVVNRLKIVSDSTVEGISKLMLNVTIPATILMGLKDSGSLSNLDILQMSLFSILSYVFVFLLSFIILRVLLVKKEERPFYQYISIFGNIGFIGYPMIIILIGTNSVLLGTIPNIFYSLLLYTLGIFLMSQYSDEKKELKFNWKRLINPGIISAILCISLFFLKIQLPSIISKTADILGNLTSPLAMIVVGASINKIDLRKILKNYRIIIISLLKMIAYPIIYAHILKLIGFSGIPAMVSVVFMGMPIATTAVITAMEYNKKNLVKASEASVFSTLMLLFTIPILTFAVSIVI